MTAAPDYFSVVVLAIVQGLTEFLPVSSSAHLVLIPRWLGWSDQGLTVDVATHTGTLFAVLVYFRSQLIDMTRGTWSSLTSATMNADSRYLLNVAVATVPVVVMGFFFKDFIETHARTTLVIAGTTLGFGVLLGWADNQKRQTKSEPEISIHHALLIGGAQALALIPGTSRSGITITCALFLGFTRLTSSRFACLLAIPTIAAAMVLTMYDVLTSDAEFFWDALVIALVVSAIAAFVCIKAFLAFVERVGMAPFAIYRIILGLFLFISVALAW